MNEITRDDLYIAAAQRVNEIIELTAAMPGVWFDRHDLLVMALRQVVSEQSRDRFNNHNLNRAMPRGVYCINGVLDCGGLSKYMARTIANDKRLTIHEKITYRGMVAIFCGDDGITCRGRR